MWRNITKTLSNAILTANSNLQQHVRTTFILKRRVKPFLSKAGCPPKKMRNRHYIYDLVKDTSIEKQPNIEVILTNYVQNVGNSGDRISVKPTWAYYNLLLPGLAVYATPENAEEYENTGPRPDVVRYSSPFVHHTINALQKINLSVAMNKDSPWTIQPWHIKSSFRKCGFIVPEEAITIPSKPIKGPDLNLESKEFYVTVTINNTEKVNVRCHIHHWSTDVLGRLPHEEKFWEKPADPIFAEDAEVLSKLPSRANTKNTGNEEAK